MLPAPRLPSHLPLFFFAFLLITPARADDFRPAVEDALRRGDKQIVISPGVYRLAPMGQDKCVWTVRKAADVEIIADGVTLVSTRLTRAITLTECRNVTLRGLTLDYDPLPFTQGRVVAAAEDHSWIDVKLDAGYPRQPYARIDVVDPATRYRKWGMPFLWGARAEMRGGDVVRVLRDGIGKAASVGELASLSTGPAPDGIPHAFALDRCENVTLRSVTVHSAPGMGILEADGEGGNQFLHCRVVPGPVPAGATEPRLLSTSWDAMQSKTIRRGPRVEGCEIREAGDDSWSVQSSDFLVLRKTGSTLILASRDAHTRGVQTGDRLTSAVGAPEAIITARRRRYPPACRARRPLRPGGSGDRDERPGLDQPQRHPTVGCVGAQHRQAVPHLAPHAATGGRLHGLAHLPTDGRRRVRCRPVQPRSRPRRLRPAVPRA